MQAAMPSITHSDAPKAAGIYGTERIKRALTACRQHARHVVVAFGGDVAGPVVMFFERTHLRYGSRWPLKCFTPASISDKERITMRHANRWAVLPVYLLMVACAYGQDIHYNYAPGTNFASYKTYQWVEIPGGAAPDQLIDQAIKRAVDEQLAQKGLTKVEKDADLCVGYQAIIKEEKAVNLWGTGAGPGWLGSWGGLNTVQGQTSTIPVGTLALNVFDREKKQLIWRGDASKTIDLKKDPDKNYANLQKAVAKLFKNYPPHTSK